MSLPPPDRSPEFPPDRSRDVPPDGLPDRADSDRTPTAAAPVPASTPTAPGAAPAEQPGVPVRTPLAGPPLIVRRAAFTLVLTLVAISVVVTIAVDFRLGGYVLASALLLGAAARAFLPEYLCLGLLVRSRRQDVVTQLVLGIALVVSASVVPSG